MNKKIVSYIALLALSLPIIISANKTKKSATPIHKIHFFFDKNNDLSILTKNNKHLFTEESSSLFTSSKKVKNILIDPISEELFDKKKSNINCRLYFIESAKLLDKPVEDNLAPDITYEELRQYALNSSFFTRNNYSSDQENLELFRQLIARHIATKMLDKYNKNMQYPLNKTKIEALLKLAPHKKIDLLIKDTKAKQTIKKYFSNLRNIAKDESEISLLNERYKMDFDGETFDESYKLQDKILLAIRKLLLHILIVKNDFPAALTVRSPIKDLGWIWISPESETTINRPNRQVSQEITKIFVEKQTDSIATEKNENFKKQLANIPAGWDWKDFLAHFYKIHLSPKPEYVANTIDALFSLFVKDNLGLYVKNAKISSRFTGMKINIDDWHTPVIVLYINAPVKLNDYTSSAKSTLSSLLEKTDPNWGSGQKPRFNKKVNDLIFYAQSNGERKASLNPEQLKKVFQEPEYALFRPDWVGNKELKFELLN